MGFFSTFSLVGLFWNIYMQFVNSINYLYTFKNLNEKIHVPIEQISHFHQELAMNATSIRRSKIKPTISFNSTFHYMPMMQCKYSIKFKRKKYVDIFTIMALMHFYYLCGYIFLKGK